MVLGTPAIVCGPLKLALALEVHLVGFGVQQVLGIQTSLNTLGQVDFLLRVQQAHSTDLLQVILDRIGGRSCCDHTTLRVAGRSQILIIVIVSHHESALFLGLFRLLAFFLVVIILRLGFLVIIEIVIIIRIDVIEIVIEIIEIGVIHLSVLIVKDVILNLLLFLLGGGALLGGGLARGLRGRGFLRCAFLGGGFTRGGFLRGGGLFGQISLFHACRRFLGGQTYPPIDPARSAYHKDPLLARANRQLCE